jgi:hypothetical protein
MHWRPPARRTLVLALVAYGAILALVLLSPTSDVQSDVASRITRALTGVGLPSEAVGGGRVPFLCNALLLMPVSALGSLLWPRTTWREWTSYAFVIAFAVELLQGVLLPARTASFADVVANTLGGLGGAAVVTVLRRLGDVRTGRRAASGSDVRQ